ncbi:DUF4405 domain-containing protein [Eubacterium sp. MSJ-13]|uniref:DUF4405 domain-containing protein n=1 Tax=Eubacterium sp. MSJ-13 TaxID=2841513 RepID=UPI001C1277A4|nr:DUF4405 domain-containing protein [Eubacterium sp. MSJ-13]MBU5477860.1 DUF4405 domain-containing protein [Eubacterium sp. MSJ-13]
MNKRLMFRIFIDICMTVCLLLLMPYSLLSETAHEWIGMAMLVLFLAHHFFNIKWLHNITKGRYQIFRVVQTLLVAAMIVLMAGSMVSGILLSNHLFKAVRVVKLSAWARQVHMFCAYWGFAVMSAHLGIHWNIVVNMTGRLFKKPSAVRRYIARFVAIIAAGYGIYAADKRQIPDYLLMKNHFVFYDYTESVVFFIADYIAVMILIAFVSYYLGIKLRNISYKRAV